MKAPDRWTAEELAAFLDAARDGRLEAAWHLAATAGLRIGELLALRWSQVDLDRARIEVRDAVIGVPYAAISPPAISRRARAIDVDPGMVVHLLNHAARQQAERSEWSTEYRDQGLVICCENGDSLHPRSLSRAFAEVAAGAGLRPIPVASIRHTQLALSVRQGAST